MMKDLIAIEHKLLPNLCWEQCGLLVGWRLMCSDKFVFSTAGGW